MRSLFVSLSVSLCLAANVPAQAVWALMYPTVSPPHRDASVMAAHVGAGQLVLFSGAGNAGGGWTYLADCWVMDGTTWSPVVGPIPPQRINAAMVYDAARERVVLFGGYGSGYLADTWEWDGTTWTQRTSPVTPPGRELHALAYDYDREVVVLFGGKNSSPALGDVWEWDGTGWVDVTPGGGPGALRHPVMAFDPVRRDIVMYGGQRVVGGTNVLSTETWSWDGAGWSQRSPALPPWARGQDCMVSDLRRQRVVLHGGDMADPFTWEWDGSEWTMRMQGSPGPRNLAAMASDPAAGAVYLFGGSVLAGRANDLWSFATSAMAAVEPYGSGCAGSSGTPHLTNSPYRLPWLGDTYESELSGLVPGSVGAFFVTGYAATGPVGLGFVGMPGCDLVVAPTVVEFASANNQRAAWQLNIPNSVALAGVQVFQQGLALDASANAAGIVISNGIEITVGIR